MLDDTPISDGIRYARNQRVGLSRFLDDGRLPIHNKMSELALRRKALLGSPRPVFSLLGRRNVMSGRPHPAHPS